MRYHVGRRVGKRGHVGVSVSDKEMGGCLKRAFTWPFLLVYFVCIWPFIWLFKKFRASTATWQKVLYIGLAVALFIIIAAGVYGASKDDSPETIEPTPPPVYEVVVPEITPEPTIAPTPEPTPTAEPTPAPVHKYIGADELNLRAEPSRDADILGEYRKGDRLEILEEVDEWYKVDINGTVGYMVQEYIVDERPVIVYWSSSGSKYHAKEDCRTFDSDTHIYSGTKEDAADEGKDEPCGVCIG